jgi:hypothetical protein
MTSAPTTPLRQRMIEDMSIRQFGERTQHGYVSVVADFSPGSSAVRQIGPSRRTFDDTSCTWRPKAPRRPR